MAAAPLAAAIVRIHSQYLNHCYRKWRFIVISRHPVTEFTIHGTLVAQFTGSLFGPAAKWRLPKIVVQTIIPGLGALPEYKERYLAIRCPLVDDAQHRPNLELHFFACMRDCRKQDEQRYDQPPHLIGTCSQSPRSSQKHFVLRQWDCPRLRRSVVRLRRQTRPSSFVKSDN